jgi:hypothetical protein
MASKYLKNRSALEAGNRATAEIIASDPQKFPPGSLMLMWAEMVLQGGTNIGAELRARPPAERSGPDRRGDAEDGR